MMKGRAKQEGSTLVELLAGMAITALIIGAIVGLIFQEWSGTATAKTSVTVAHEIRNAARWISQDGMMAENTDLAEEADLVDRLTMTWIERYDFANIPHSSSYFLEGTQLRRDYDGIVTTVARNISKIEFSQTGRLLTVSISSTPQWWKSATVEKSYNIYLRTAEDS